MIREDQYTLGLLAAVGLTGFAIGALLPRKELRCLLRRVLHGSEAIGHSRGGRRPTIVCLGDSLTQFGFDPENVGWVGLLANQYSRKADVINRGFSGYNARWIALMFEDMFGCSFRRHPPILVTICLGANDACFESSEQYIPLSEYRATIKTLVESAQALGRDVAVVVITAPPLHGGDWTEHRRSQGGQLDRAHDRTKTYGDAAIDVAIDTGVPYVDLYDVLEGSSIEKYRSHLCDGLHLSASGNKKLFEALASAIKTHYPHIDPDQLEMQGPLWSDVPAVLGTAKHIPLYTKCS